MLSRIEKDPMQKFAQQIYKYPRTQHIQGSRLQPGDEDLESVPFDQIAGRHLVVEEKMDGANCGISFSPDRELQLQSRGHYLTGGRREKHFDIFKTWAGTHAAALYDVLGDRYVMYGEWLYAKHTVYYNRLPHYFMEFDILDTATGTYLSTPARKNLLQPLDIVRSVKVLHQGPIERIQDLTAHLGPSHFIGEGHMEQLGQRAREQGLDAERAKAETDPTATMEGLYIKVEENGAVAGRFKYVRASFLTTVMASESHWLNRPIIANLLVEGVDLFGGWS
jgi:hypothetical protein